jgi:hypothetical protein
MADCYSEPGTDILYPWTVTGDAADLWNKFFSKPFGWRVFTTGKSGSSKKAAYRLTMIIRRNAAWLGGSAKSDTDFLYAQWRIYMIGAAAYLEKHGVEDTSANLDRQIDITMTFWRFQEPSLKHLHVMFNDNLGIDPDGALAADQDRRKQKAEIINGFKDTIHGFLKDAVYLSGSDNQRLERALALASQTLDQVRDDLRWESDEPPERVPMEDRHGRMKAGPSAETAMYLEDD